jgi:hypothetical protein
MTKVKTVGAVSSGAAEWYAIDWQAIHQNVRRLQVRIVQATKESFPYRSRVSLKEAFAGLELCARKLACTVLRGPGPSNGAWLLGPICFSPFPLGVPHEPNRELGSSPPPLQ